MKIFTKLIIFIVLIFQSYPLLSNEKLKVGLIKYKTQEIVTETYRPFIDYLSKKLNIEIDLQIVNSDNLGYSLANNEFDMGIFTPFPYLEAKIHFPELEAFATNIVSGAIVYTGGIIVRESSGINNLYELKGKRFSFIKPTSTSGFNVPKSIFQEFDIDIDSEFFTYNFSGSHEKSIDYLLADSVDGIAVDLDALNDYSKEDLKQFKILRKYDMPMHAYVFSPSLDKDLKDKIKFLMYNAYKDPTANDLFENQLDIEGWVQVDDEYYNQMRRYLRLVRVKPNARFEYDIADGALQSLEKKGDIINIIIDNIQNELSDCNRFADNNLHMDNSDNYYQIKLSLSQIDNDYFYQIYQNNKRLSKGTLSETDLITGLHSITINSVLNNMDINTELLNSQNKWFITYGSNDGINIHDYEFILDGRDFKILEVDSVTDFNTFLKADSLFKEGNNIKIKYIKKGSELNYSGSDSLEDAEEALFDDFWSNLDNVWGVIGIIVALITLLIGYILWRYRHKRFTRILHSTNSLLKDFIEGKYLIETRLIEQTEFMNTALEKGYINENQYVILKSRIEDIRIIIENQDIKTKLSLPDVKDEIENILADGIITEKEYSRLMSILAKYKKK